MARLSAPPAIGALSQQVRNEQLECICWEFDQHRRSVNEEYCTFQISAQFYV